MQTSLPAGRVCQRKPLTRTRSAQHTGPAPQCNRGGPKQLVTWRTHGRTRGTPVVTRSPRSCMVNYCPLSRCWGMCSVPPRPSRKPSCLIATACCVGSRKTPTLFAEPTRRNVGLAFCGALGPRCLSTRRYMCQHEFLQADWHCITISHQRIETHHTRLAFFILARQSSQYHLPFGGFLKPMHGKWNHSRLHVSPSQPTISPKDTWLQ